jgi:hypothetical protein
MTFTRINKILAIAVALWAVAAAVYFLGFAQTSYQGISISATQGELPTSTPYSGQQSWVSSAGPIAITAVLTMSGFLVAGALAVRRGSLSGMATLAAATLAGSYVTGFSIGGLYFPGALALAIGTGLAGVEALGKRLRRPTSPPG